MGILDWLESTPVAEFVRVSAWGYPTILTLHAIGMGLVVGMAFVIQLRLAGFAARIPLAALARLFVIAWIGIILNAISGALLYTADAVKFTYNWPFRVKLLMILGAALSLYLLTNEIKADSVAASSITPKAKLLAALSTLFWLGAITAGRLIAYITRD